MSTEMKSSAGWLKDDLERAAKRLEQLTRAERSVTCPADRLRDSVETSRNCERATVDNKRR